jgi:hypothetical protein
MKKKLLFLTLILVCLYTHAQKLDKKLLYGKWDLYSMDTPEGTLCRDSLRQYIAAEMEVEKRNAYTRLTAEDSLATVTSKEATLSTIFQTVFAFDREGHFTQFLSMGGQLMEDKGMYKWRGKNKVILKTGKSLHMLHFIMELTETKLVLGQLFKSEVYNSKMYIRKTFTRAK